VAETKKSTSERAKEAAERAQTQETAAGAAAATSAVAGVSAQGSSAPTGDPDSKADGKQLEKALKAQDKAGKDAFETHQANEKAREDLAEQRAKVRADAAKGKTDAVQELAESGKIGQANAVLPSRGLVINPDEGTKELIASLGADPRAAGLADASDVVDASSAVTNGAHVRENEKGQLHQVSQFRTDF
jgi:hypothetical protein